MALEIEHKFLLADERWRGQVYKSAYFKQGYLSSLPTTSVRVRISDDKAWLNIKSATIGNQRLEFEYEIPLTDADTLLDALCAKPLIEKTRHFIKAEDGHVWEIDEFAGENTGLIVAEIELASLDENFSKPEWLGQEVTHDLRYYNNNLAQHPYNLWGNT
jgi:adenylate cyclase